MKQTQETIGGHPVMVTKIGPGMYRLRVVGRLRTAIFRQFFRKDWRGSVQEPTRTGRERWHVLGETKEEAFKSLLPALLSVPERNLGENWP